MNLRWAPQHCFNLCSTATMELRRTCQRTYVIWLIWGGPLRSAEKMTAWWPLCLSGGSQTLGISGLYCQARKLSYSRRIHAAADTTSRMHAFHTLQQGLGFSFSLAFEQHFVSFLQHSCSQARCFISEQTPDSGIRKKQPSHLCKIQVPAFFTYFPVQSGIKESFCITDFIFFCVYCALHLYLQG